MPQTEKHGGEARPKVVRIIGRLVSGPARQACLLHQELISGFQTRLICGSPCTGEHDMGYLLGSEEHVFRLAGMSREISLADLKALWDIYRFLRRERPQLVHTHTAKAGALGRSAAWLARVPIIVHTYHGHVFHGYFGPQKTRMFLALERLLGRITTRVVAISESQKEELSRHYQVVPPEKISVVKNGFHFAHFSPEEREQARTAFGFEQSDFVLVWAGRMAPVKDIQLLAEVARAAHARASNARFLVVGDGEERAGFEERVRDCANVRVLGWQRDMDQVWRAADVAILTSRNEGTPTALIEAMAAGLPFVSTQVGAVHDLAAGTWEPLPDGMGFKAANGIMTERDPKALLYSVEELTNDRAGARRMGEAGRQFVRERFAAPRLVAEISALYRALLTETFNHTRWRKSPGADATR